MRFQRRSLLTRDVVINELAPLHHHGGELVGGDVLVAVDEGADHARTGQRLAVDAEPDALHAVAVLGRQEALERAERGAPLGVLQVVARAVGGAVQGAERRTLDLVRAQRAVAVKVRLSQRNAALVAEPIALTYRHSVKNYTNQLEQKTFSVQKQRTFHGVKSTL